MRTLLQRIGVACFALFLSVGVAHAVDIDLMQSGGSKTKLGGSGDAAKVVIVSGSGVSVGGCTPTAAAPTYLEGILNALSCTLSGALRVTLDTLLAGEDQTNNLLMTSGGVVRGTEGNIINSAVGNATSTAFQLPTGNKSITARITGAGAVAQVITIYGGTSSGMAAATSNVICTITLSGTSGAAGTADMCPPFVAPALFYIAVTTGSTGTPTTILTASY